MENSNTEDSVSQSVPPSTVNTQPWWRAVGYGSSRPVLPSGSIQVTSRQNQIETNGYDCEHSTDDRGENKVIQDAAAEGGPNGSFVQDQPLQPTNGQVLQMADYYMPHTQLELRPSIACAPYPYTDPYYSSMMAAAYGTQPLAHPQFIGMPQNRLALPLEMAEEPVYVNAKQYHGILRRRQSRAKAELEKKLVKVRKPYLHESRHQHAMRRARGCGGRFLNTKKSDGETTNTSVEKDKSSDAGTSVQSGSSCSENMNSGASQDAESRKCVSQKGSFQQRGFPFDEREDGDCSGQQRNDMLAKRCRTVTIQ